jgi:hypothetical protein
MSRIAFLCFVFTSVSALAQDYIAPTPEKYYFQVKQFDEFVKRFNYKTDVVGNAITDSFPISRKNYILYLFNHLDKRLLDKEYMTQIENFTGFVTDSVNPVFIDKFGKEITAIAETRVKYKNHEENIVLELKPERLTDHSVKWALSDALMPFALKKSDSVLMFIPPNAHESNFIALKQLLNNKSGVSAYAYKGFKPDGLTLFFNEIENRNLEILYTQKMYYFITWAKWQIKVEEFVRADYNSGWLISDLKRIP